ncbi:MAG TPA: hypothetical protein DEV98_01450 [Clostridiales bacterium]|nr:hypothetical protein [Clostridiales bacterium]
MDLFSSVFILDEMLLHADKKTTENTNNKIIILFIILLRLVVISQVAGNRTNTITTIQIIVR